MNKTKVGALIGIAIVGGSILTACGSKIVHGTKGQTKNKTTSETKYEASAKGQTDYEQQFSGVVTNSSDSRVFVDVTNALTRKASVLTKSEKVVLLTDNTTIKNESNTRLKSVDLKKGDKIEFVLVDNPILLRSMPPQITGSSIVEIVKV